jgi:hypothetical protein
LRIRGADGNGGMTVENSMAHTKIHAAALPQIMLHVFEAGGLVPYLRSHGDFQL